MDKQMTKCDVHIFAVVRIKVVGVEATDHEDAITKALKIAAPLDTVVGDISHNDQVTEVEYAEEISHYLVDDVGPEVLTENCEWYIDSDHKAALNRASIWSDPEYPGGAP